MIDQPTPEQLTTVSTFAMRLVLSCLNGDGDPQLIRATLAKLDRDSLEALVVLIAGLAAGVWSSAKGHDVAVADLTRSITELLDTADQHREDDPA